MKQVPPSSFFDVKALVTLKNPLPSKSSELVFVRIKHKLAWEEAAELECASVTLYK